MVLFRPINIIGTPTTLHCHSDCAILVLLKTDIHICIYANLEYKTFFELSVGTDKFAKWDFETDIHIYTASYWPQQPKSGPS